MNDCLVTKLKASVDGNLPKLGVLEIEVRPTTASKSIYFAVASSTLIKFIGFLYDGVSEITISSAKTFNLSSEIEGSIVIMNKYNLTSVSITPGKASSDANTGFYINPLELYYCNRLRVLGFGNSIGDFNISYLSESPLSAIRLNFTEILGDLSSLVRNTTLTEFQTAFTNLKGNLSSLRNSTGITRLNLQGTLIEGDVQDLADGRNEGSTLRITLANTDARRITFNGLPNLNGENYFKIVGGVFVRTNSSYEPI